MQALEWVEYNGKIPKNAISVIDSFEVRHICRTDAPFGIVNEKGKCQYIKIGRQISEKKEFDILVNHTLVNTVDSGTFVKIEEIVTIDSKSNQLEILSIDTEGTIKSYKCCKQLSYASNLFCFGSDHWR